MRVPTRLWPALGAGLAALLVFAGAAWASPFTTLYNEYRQTGQITACKHTAAELQSAVAEVPPDISQYAPDFPAALQSALQARAVGSCAGKKDSAAPAVAATGPVAGAGGATGAAGPLARHGSTPSPAAAPAQSQATIAKLASTARSSGASAAPAPVIALAIATALLAAMGLWWIGAAARGRDPRWLGPTRHALAEAGFRAEGALAEFGDWLRLGR